MYNAGMAELADAQDLGSCEAIRVGSTPTIRTTPAVSKSRTAGVSFILREYPALKQVSILQRKPSSKLPLPIRAPHFVGCILFCARVYSEYFFIM